MKNLAGQDPKHADAVCSAELAAAGIDVHNMGEWWRTQNGEVKTSIFGALYKWSFKRAWYYWVAEGPGIPPVYANALHAAHGDSVRVDGHCASPSPYDWFKGFAVGLYHVDTQEGLNALAATLRQIIADAEQTNRPVA